MSRLKLLKGNNIELLKGLPENSIDSVVTDPPYGLSFMGKKWDYDVPSVEFWKEVFRVLKPGGHVLSFGGTRTYHRMVVNIEDAGFEIRDQIMWLYGSGFPKSLNIGKAVDKLEGNEREVVGIEKGAGSNKFTDGVNGLKPEYEDTKGTSDWEGWGTALKPANEPICLARKPLSEKTIAENVLKWKTGGINIDGCRIGNEKIETIHNPKITGKMGQSHGEQMGYIEGDNTTHEGRFPANIILECICDDVIKGDVGDIKKSSGSRKDCDLSHEWGYKEIVRTNFTDKGDIHTNPLCPCKVLDEQSGISGSTSKVKKTTRQRKYEAGGGSMMTNKREVEAIDNYGDKGGASRFFYVAKVSKKERNLGCEGLEDKVKIQQIVQSEGRKDAGSNESSFLVKNNHPTVKPINLMTYLCRLITPPNGIVLDPFMGSGSTGIAAQLEGFRFCGMEMDGDYFTIAEKRINNWEEYKKIIK